MSTTENLDRTLNVRIVGTNLLDVDETTKQNEFEVNERLRSITFKLVDAPADCCFGVFLADDTGGPGDTGDPGFDVVCGKKPNKNYIRKPERSADFKTITVGISHRSEYSNGEWIYILRAYRPNGEEFSTLVACDDDSRSFRTVSNPVIINK